MLCYRAKWHIVCLKWSINSILSPSGFNAVAINTLCYVVPSRLNKMEFNRIELCDNLVLIWACNMQRGLLLRHTSFMISFVPPSNAMDQMLCCYSLVFKYISIVCQCLASTNAFPMCQVCITYCLQVACTDNQWSVPHIEHQESGHGKYKTRHVWVTKCIDTETVRQLGLRCRHHLRFDLPLPQSLIGFCRSHSQWMYNDCPGFWIRDGGRHDLKTAERIGSDRIAGCSAGYRGMCWLHMWGSSRSVCTRHGSQIIYWLWLWSGQVQSSMVSELSNLSIVQQRWGGGVWPLDFRCHATPSLRGIPLTS
jgi:hypothetical protein